MVRFSNGEILDFSAANSPSQAKQNNRKHIYSHRWLEKVGCVTLDSDSPVQQGLQPLTAEAGPMYVNKRNLAVALRWKYIK